MSIYYWYLASQKGELFIPRRKEADSEEVLDFHLPFTD
jgi:hypothetical protein